MVLSTSAGVMSVNLCNVNVSSIIIKGSPSPVRFLSIFIADADNSNFSGYCNNQIISYIYPGKYDNFQAADFPADVKKHVEDENFVLCLYTLK